MSAGIRPFEAADVPDVAALYELVARSGVRRVEPAVVDWLHRVVLGQPWADPEVPSLVATGPDGEVVGFLASHVRRLCVDGRPVRMGCSGQLVVDPLARSSAAGARLLATYLRGPQEVSITDGASEQVALMWERLGGERAPLQQLEWVRLVRPWRHPAHLLRRVRQRCSSRTYHEQGEPPPKVPAAVLDPQLLLEVLVAAAARSRLAVDYDRAYLRWLWPEVGQAGLGQLRAQVVDDPGSRTPGLFAYYSRPGGIADVVCLLGEGDAGVTTVLQALLADARQQGAAVLRGRVEPRLLGPVTAARSLLLRRPQALVHARDPALLHLVTSRHSLLTRLDGEWCLRPQAL